MNAFVYASVLVSESDDAGDEAKEIRITVKNELHYVIY